MNASNPNKPSEKISPNYRESAESEPQVEKNQTARVENLHDFAAKNAIAKSSVQELIKLIVREVRRERLTYDQLRYVFKAVRHRCELEAASKHRRLVELPTREEIGRFMDAIESPTSKLIFETLHQTGLRVSELCALEVRRLDLKNNTLFVSAGKGKVDRVVIVGNLLAQKLALYLEGRSNRWVFESQRRTRYSPRRIQQLCAKFRKVAGIEKTLTVHTWRHIFITRLAEAGVSRERRAVLAGHSDERVQSVYTHLSGGGLKSEILIVLDKIARGEL